MSPAIDPADLAEKAMDLDFEDPLASFRRHFELPGGLYYFDGNSLGPLTGESLRRLAQVAEKEWGGQLVTAWNRAGWIDLAAATGSRIARLLGAEPDEVLVADSTSVNLFKLLAGALELRPERRLILCQQEHFPSDLYIAEGVAALRGQGFEVRLAAREDFQAALSEEVAVFCCSQVDFRTGELLDMKALNQAARRVGALSCWDLSHSAGALPVALGEAGADLAVGCGYKFLNGGPGAPAFLYVRGDLQAKIRNPLPGWLGHREPFAFSAAYEPAPGIERFLCGTPPILSLACLDAALEVFDTVDLHALRQKSLALGDFFLELLARLEGGIDIEVITPRETARRGSQISLRHPDAYALVQAMIARNVVTDFRAPDIIRFGITPLYQRYLDFFYAAMALHDLLASGEYRDARYQERAKVT